jgi:hypothetical protein
MVTRERGDKGQRHSKLTVFLNVLYFYSNNDIIVYKFLCVTDDESKATRGDALMGKAIRILSIDGGGIRGLIPGQVLVCLEEILQEKTNNKQARIADFFDLIAGTSTGGILSCIYLFPDRYNPKRPCFSSQAAVDFYRHYGPAIFRRPWWHILLSCFGLFKEKYPAKYFERCLTKFFGELKLSQLLKPCLISAYQIEKRYAHFFRQSDAIRDPEYDFLVKDVARATSAAPTYFKAAGIKSLTKKFYPLIDGGVFANNPALCALSEVFRSFGDIDDLSQIIIISLGTGADDKPLPYRSAKNWGIIQWAVPIIDVLMSGNPETVDYQLKTIFRAFGLSQNYLRIEPRLPDNLTGIDSVSKAKMQALVNVGKVTALNYYQDLCKFADLLLSRHWDKSHNFPSHKQAR